MEQGEQDLVDVVVDATGLSEAAVRSVLWQTRRAGWHIVRFHESYEPIPIAEEWTP